MRSDQSRFLIALTLAAIGVLSACGGAPASQHDRSGSRPDAGDGHVSDWFDDRAEAAGLDFTYFNGMSGEFYFREMLGGGVALFDYDNDGDLDIYFAQGRMLGEGKTIDRATIPPGSTPLRGRLYRNDLTIEPDGTRVLHFADETAESGIDAFGYGMGVATGDFDNDGCVDLI